MQIFKVGGAVRDKILNRPVSDNDYVVIGATPKQMQNLGYKKIGKSFPVFLHPVTGEEYALARKEIKTAPGHTGFKFVFSPDITLKEDSLRRDFTCNALYENLSTGEIIDYHHGKEDIKKRILRHISPHFAEDPLRVLRMCRFAAVLDFSVAPETMSLCRQMVEEGALKHLSATRIWGEFLKALSSPSFYRFVETARECGALNEILPEVNRLWDIPERTDYHPEKNSGAHTMLAIKAAKSSDAYINLAVLLHDVGKTKTDPALWPSHRGHPEFGAELVKNISSRLCVPKSYKEFVVFTTQNHMIYHCPLSETKRKLAALSITLAHKKNWFMPFINVLQADMKGRLKTDFSAEEASFACFKTYLERLTAAAASKKMNTIKDFSYLTNKINRRLIAPTAIKEAYIDELLSEVAEP